MKDTLAFQLYKWAQQLGRPVRRCHVCNAYLTPHSESTLTAHEFECYRASGNVPEHHKAQFESTMKWFKRSQTAKRAAAKRKENQRVKGNHHETH